MTTQRRYANREELAELINLYHIARTAGSESRYDRMLWASQKFANDHIDWTAPSAYKSLSEALN